MLETGLALGHLTFLGTGDSKGVPRFWCACPVCTEARQSGQNRRTRTGFLLTSGDCTALLDASADLHAQLVPYGPLSPRFAFFSHAHNDHILGLADLLDYARSGDTGADALAMYTPAAVLPQLAERFAYAFRQPPPVQIWPDAGVMVGRLNLRCFEVPHGANGHSHAYFLQASGFRAAIVTDALDIPEAAARAWLSDLDVLVLGTSFVDESGMGPHWSRSVYDIREASALPWAQSARRVILTHLSHDVDARAVSLPRGWTLAHDGLTVELGVVEAVEAGV